MVRPTLGLASVAPMTATLAGSEERIERPAARLKSGHGAKLTAVSEAGPSVTSVAMADRQLRRIGQGSMQQARFDRFDQPLTRPGS